MKISKQRSAQDLYDLGTRSIEIGDVNGAERAYRKALEIDPNFLLAWVDLGNVLAETLRIDEAKESFSKALAIDSENEYVWVNFGVLYSQIGNMVKAEEAYLKAIEFDPNYSLAWYNYGDLLVKSSRIDEAKEAFLQVIKNDSTFSFAWLNLGTLCVAQKEYEKAVSYFVEYLDLEPYAPQREMLEEFILKQAQFSGSEPLTNETQHFVVGITAWCSKCRSDGCMGRIKILAEGVQNEVPQRIIVLYEKRCGKHLMGYDDIPKQLCGRCGKKFQYLLSQYREQGLAIEYGNPEIWNSETEYDDSSINDEAVLSERKAHSLLNRAQEAWRGGNLIEGDTLAFKAEDLIDPSNGGNCSYRKAGWIHAPQNYELAISLLDDALEKSPFFENKPAYWDKRAVAFNRVNRYEEAIQSYYRSIELRHGKAGSQWHSVAEILWEIGREEARKIMSDPQKVPLEWYKPSKRKMGLL